MTVPLFMLRAEKLTCLYPPNLQQGPVLILREYRALFHTKCFRITKVCKLIINRILPQYGIKTYRVFMRQQYGVNTHYCANVS